MKKEYRSCITVPIEANSLNLYIEFKHPQKAFGFRIFKTGRAYRIKSWKRSDED